MQKSPHRLCKAKKQAEKPLQDAGDKLAEMRREEERVWDETEKEHSMSPRAMGV